MPQANKCVVYILRLVLHVGQFKLNLENHKYDIIIISKTKAVQTDT